MTEPLNDGFDQPQEISAALRAFPASVRDLMPAYDAIPEEFKGGGTDWNKFISSWFFTGWPQDRQLIMRDDVNGELAYLHISTILRSFEPKHEHKEAACAWLLSRWFEAIRA